MPTILTAFRDADDEERRRLLPDRLSAPSSRGNRRNTHRPSSSSVLLGALASASIVALVGVRARGGSMTTNESSASLGAGRSRSQMLSGLAAAAPCLDKCAGAERDGVRRLQSGNGTCADADAIEDATATGATGASERIVDARVRREVPARQALWTRIGTFRACPLDAVVRPSVTALFYTQSRLKPHTHVREKSAKKSARKSRRLIGRGRKDGKGERILPPATKRSRR